MGSCESSQRSNSRKNGTSGNRSEDVDTETADVSLETIGAVAVVVVACSVVALFSSLRGSNTDERKTMKAPGRNYRIFRDDFEDDPAGYFRSLRK
ncbi:hypothetical protein MANES_05G111400v8 [Manihot esculenta]|uniref:Uncharacterized protein n=1 Tax=Manihot esculenta TaxID=3983 RepID=A0A2C9VXN5_MANES|nr:hypothetical protein MANES_05G111400v8 [Manihot esculenta]